MLPTIVDQHSVDFAVWAWLHEKKHLSYSAGTETLYRGYLDSFRTALRSVGLDLDGDAQRVAIVLQAWANGPDDKPYSPYTTNNRIAVVSSFYEYCLRRGLAKIVRNPAIDTVRRRIQPYADARALDYQTVVKGLIAIDRTTLQGKRDYALLAVALVTGRRLTEIRNLRCVDVVTDAEDRVTLEWQRTKGGKKMRDKLPRVAGNALLDYLKSLPVPCEYVFVGVATRNGHNYQRLSHVTLEGICRKHLDTSKFHSLRHSFAHAMEETGAKVSDIQSRLGHTNIGTTGRYLQSLRAEDNPKAEEVARLFGL